MTSPLPPIPTPTPGFEFPAELGDMIDKKLRQGVNQNGARPVLESVRPERRAPVVPEFTAPVATAPQSSDYLVDGMVTHRHLGQSDNGQTRPVGMDAPLPLILNQHPPVTPMPSADMTSIDLPSKFAYYSFKDLYVKALRVPHLAKLAKATDLSSMQLIAEVVSSVLATPGGDTNIGFKLSIADFNSVLYWLRANSFKRPTMRVNYTCSNPAHHEAVNLKKKDRQTLENEVVADTSVLDTSYLDQRPDPLHYHLKLAIGEKTYRVEMRPETVMDSIEFLDDPRFDQEDFQYLVRIASMLDVDSAFFRPDEHGVHKRWTLQEKVGIVEDHLSNDDVLLVLEFSDLVDRFGINEVINVKCKECGYGEQIKLTIDARTFSSPRF